MTERATNPAVFHVDTPHGAASLCWLDVPAAPRAAQHQAVRRQAALLLDRHFPLRSLARLHWPPGSAQPPDLAYAALAAPQAEPDAQVPDLWLSWSYAPGQRDVQQVSALALLAAAPFPVGVDVARGSQLPRHAWAEVLALYGGEAPLGVTPADAAEAWARIEASEKCLRSGLREWSPAVAAERARCTCISLPLADPDAAAVLAFAAPPVGR